MQPLLICPGDFYRHDLFLFTVYIFTTEFSSCEATVISLRYDKEFVDEIKDGQLAGVLLDHTCFYAEQGGQVYDTGFITKTRDEVCGGGGCTLYMKLVYWQIESSFLILWWWCMAVHSWWSNLSDNNNYWYSKRIDLDFLECSSVQTVSFEFLLYKCSFSSWCNSSPDLRSAIRVGLLDYTIACCIHHSMHVHWLCNVFWLLRCVVRFNGLWGFLLWTHLAPALGFTIL